MKIKFHDDFKQDYLAVKKSVDDPQRLDRELRTIAHALQAGRKLPSGYITNEIPFAGSGWYECFAYRDRRHIIIMQYKIKGMSVYLARIGTPSALTKKIRLG